MSKDIMEKNPEIRSSIAALEDQMRQVETLVLEPVHHFADGCYIRELFMPAGSIVTSKIHKTEHFAMILQGSATVIQEDGERYIEAPFITVTKPGTKRALYIHEDCVWVTIHPTKHKTVEDVEKDIIAMDFEEFE